MKKTRDGQSGITGLSVKEKLARREINILRWCGHVKSPANLVARCRLAWLPVWLIHKSCPQSITACVEVNCITVAVPYFNTEDSVFFRRSFDLDRSDLFSAIVHILLRCPCIGR